MGCGSSSEHKPVSKTPATSKATQDTQITELDGDDEDFFLQAEKAAIISYKNQKNLDNPPKQNGHYNYQSDLNSNNIQQKKAVAVPAKTQQKAALQHVSKTGEKLLIEGIEDESQPSAKPSQRRRKELIPDIAMFKAIDDHAAKAPKSATISVEELSKYLSRPAKNHLETIRAFYKWIQLNISYDAQAFFSGNFKPTDPDAVLRLGSSVCSGYSNLFEALCKHAGVNCRVITGFAKGYGYTPDKSFSLQDKTNHAWNVVFLSGDWYFVESTWGTGHVNQSMAFERKNTDFWFLTEPEHFINDHFPYIDNDLKSSQQWQLLQKPMDLETFNKRAKVEKQSLEYGIQYSNLESIINVKEKFQMTVRATTETMDKFNAELVKDDGTDCSQYVMSEKTDQNTYIVTVKPPSKSAFTLKIMGGVSEEGNSYHYLANFSIKCDQVESNLQPYPKLFGYWGASKDITKYGFTESAGSCFHYIVDGGECEIKLPTFQDPTVTTDLKHAEKTFKDIKSCVMLQSTRDSLIAKVRLPEVGYYKLLLFGKVVDGCEDAKYELIMNFLIECTKPAQPWYAYPTVYNDAQKYQVILVEPTIKDIPANAETTFIFTSRLLTKVLAGGKSFEKPDSDRWEFAIITPDIGQQCVIFGKGDDSSPKFTGLFEFKTV